MPTVLRLRTQTVLQIIFETSFKPILVEWPGHSCPYPAAPSRSSALAAGQQDSTLDPGLRGRLGKHKAQTKQLAEW